MTDIWSESEERNECPECDHPWYLHSEDGCTQRLCSCTDGKRAVWALPIEEYLRYRAAAGKADSTAGK